MKRPLIGLGILLIALASCQPAQFLQPPSPTPSITATPITTGSGRVQLGDITMYYEVYGQGTPLVLIHGGMGSTNSWVNQIPVFSQTYRVIALDSRGQGRTTDANVPLGYHLMAEDTLRLMDYLGITSAYIVGRSDGGIIGIDMAIHHPERVRALVAFGANTYPDGVQAGFLRFLREASQDDLQKSLQGDYVKLSDTPDHMPIMVEKIKTLWLTEPNFTAQELAGIKTPTLVMDGQTEELIRVDHAKEIAQAIPGAQLVMMPGTGHFATREKPAEFNKIVLDFLKDK
jgi:pimeloyl-ACP methyl ester carboxylesterase